jgi:ABC-type cobalamin/Fe3+-siderophores transport system ATPase subunit
MRFAVEKNCIFLPLIIIANISKKKSLTLLSPNGSGITKLLKGWRIEYCAVDPSD